MSQPSPNPAQAPIKGLRWWICGLLFLATTINYLDRNSLSVLKTTLSRELHWNEADYGWVTFAFSTAYALFQSPSGRLIDWLGVRISFAIALVAWSIMAGAHALAASTVGFMVVRFLLGAAEAANFPASVKAVAQWFPQRERALATGIFNSGSNLGIMLSPLTVWVAVKYGWQAAFISIGVLGLGWLVLWLWLYHSPSEHPRLGAAERAHIDSGLPPGEDKPRLPWIALLRYRQVWAFIVAKFLADPVWWFYLYWLPSYLEKQRGLTVLGSASMLIIPYLAADFGSVFGGYLSGALIRRGWRVGPARYAAMLLCAVCMPGAIVAVMTSHFWLALGLISLATAAHQGWSANVFTTATDLFPSRVAGSVVGLGGTCGALGGMLMTLLVGGTLQWTGSYVPIFIWAGLMHPLGLILFRLLAGPDLHSVVMDKPLDLTKNNPALLAGGALACLIGGGVAAVIGFNWQFFVTATKSANAPAGGLTAMTGVAVIGLILIYAGLSHKNARD
jgi:ACS family hexuronate transporter-like MFS transporter